MVGAMGAGGPSNNIQRSVREGLLRVSDRSATSPERNSEQ